VRVIEKKSCRGRQQRGKTKWLFLKKMIVAAAAISEFGFCSGERGQVKALGMVLESEGAHIGSSPVSAGASLFLGDILSTDSDGRIKVRVGQTTYEFAGRQHRGVLSGERRGHRGTASWVDSGGEQQHHGKF